MRILATICLLIASVFAPWWWTLVLLVIGIFVFRGYSESFIIATLMAIRMYPSLSFGDRIVWLGALFLCWAVLAYTASLITGHRANDLYV